jgi:uncharacterized membrane protein YeiH
MPTLLDDIEYLGTFAFAISGLRVASAKRFDLFGAYTVGFVTAVGGGTTRDLLLSQKPFWLETPSYLICTGVALLFVMVFSRYLMRMKHALFIFDTMGLGLFVSVGIEKAVALEHPLWLAVIMGMVTGAVGGILRDILVNELPLIFRKEIYALACIIGGLVYCLCTLTELNPAIIKILTITSVILARVVAVYFHIGLPVLKGEERE